MGSGNNCVCHYICHPKHVSWRPTGQCMSQKKADIRINLNSSTYSVRSNVRLFWVFLIDNYKHVLYYASFCFHCNDNPLDTVLPAALALKN